MCVSTSLLMRHFFQQLHSEPITKAEELQSAQRYMKGLTAEHVVGYRNQRLEELNQSENADLAFGFH
jgi:CHAT domain-containing protein